MHTLYVSYNFEEVMYWTPNRTTKKMYCLIYDYEIEIKLTDIVRFYFNGKTKEEIGEVIKTLQVMETNDLINYDALEDDNDFVDYLKELHKDEAYDKLVDEIEEAEREKY